MGFSLSRHHPAAGSLLTVAKGGQVFDQSASLDNFTTVLVTDAGSAWISSNALSVGSSFFSVGNILTISNGATVSSSHGFLGFLTSDLAGNTVVVMGTNSSWTNLFDLNIGFNEGNFMGQHFWTRAIGSRRWDTTRRPRGSISGPRGGPTPRSVAVRKPELLNTL